MSGRPDRLDAAFHDSAKVRKFRSKLCARRSWPSVMDARVGGRGHGWACTPAGRWRIILVVPVVCDDAKGEFRLWLRCENPLCQCVGRGYAVRRHRPLYI